MPMPPSILFLCTGNSCRSQMAEGWARALHGDRLEVASAGVEIHGLNPRAVRVMDEAGVDISGHRSQRVDEFADVEFDLVVTVCDHAAESCPNWPGGTRVVHHSFRDPAKAEGDEAAVIAVFREVRDEIRDWVSGLPARVGADPDSPGAPR